MNTLARTATALAAVAIAAAGCSSGPTASSSASPSHTTRSTVTPGPSDPAAGGLPPGPHVVTKEIGTGVNITVTIPARGWDGAPNGGYLCWVPVDECAGPPDGAGLIAFNDRQYFAYGDPCHWSTTRPTAAATTADDLVTSLANQASRRASAPEDITLDGYTGKRITLHMTHAADRAFTDGDFTDCDDGHFALFGVAGEDPARFSQGPGQVEEVWAVDVDGVVAVLIGLYYPDTPQAAVDEVRAILGSMTFGD